MEFLKEIEKLYGQYKKLDEIKLSYGRDLECYSTFDRNTILMVLTDILSEIEGDHLIMNVIIMILLGYHVIYRVIIMGLLYLRQVVVILE